MPSVTALRRWLVVVALLRLLAVYLGYFDFKRFKQNLYDKAPDQVTELHARLFALWTLLTCALCLICAKDPRQPAIYGATLLSFVVALLHFLTELLLYQTVSLVKAAAPLLIAGISALWMGCGWNYYTSYAEPDISEQETESAKQE